MAVPAMAGGMPVELARMAKVEEASTAVETTAVPMVVEACWAVVESVGAAEGPAEGVVASAANLLALLVEWMVEVVMVATRVKAEDTMEVV